MLARHRPFRGPLARRARSRRPGELHRDGALTASPVPPHGEWPTHGGTNANARYSSLDQITRDNVGRLRVAWRWTSPDEELMAQQPGIRTWLNQATPLMIGGVLYVSTSASRVAAIDAISGHTLWVHDPKIWIHGRPPNFGFVHRGVAYWTDGRDARILIGTGNAYLIALDARTGVPITSFGAQGRVDLTEGLGRPVDRRWYTVRASPLVIDDLVIVGSSIEARPLRPDMPPGACPLPSTSAPVRSDGSSTPSLSRIGRIQTWEGESWHTVGGVNVWTGHERRRRARLRLSPPSALRRTTTMAASGTATTSSPTASSVSRRPPAGGYGISSWCATGLWDYDIPAAPNLVDITIDGRRVRAVAQVSKQGFGTCSIARPASRCGRSKTTGAAVERAGRDSPAAAVPHATGAVRAPGREPGGRDRLHARAPRVAADDSLAVRSRPAIHAPQRARHGARSRRRRRRELGRRRLRSGHGPPLRAVDHRAQRRDLEPSARRLRSGIVAWDGSRGSRDRTAFRCSSRRSGP